MRACLISTLLIALGCSAADIEGGDDTTPDDTDDNGDDSTDTGPTYYRDVAPILDRHCVGCHAEGGIGPFPADTYEDAARFAPAMAAAVADRYMPPWPPDPSCSTFAHQDRWLLTDDQIATVRTWSDRGAPAGDAADAQPPPADTTIDLGEPDWVLDAGQAFTFNNDRDDLYWCIRLDPNIDQPLDLAAMTIVPGTKEIVHHVIVFREPNGVTNPTGLPGFECNPAPGKSEFMFAWAPGAQPTALPEGAAMRIGPDDALIVQVHYHAIPGAPPMQDLTRLLLYEAGAVDKLVRVVWTGSLFIDVPPGTTGSAEGVCTVPLGAQPVELIGVAPHMHEIGQRISSQVERAGNSGGECIVDIPRWDFEWQNGYMLETPIALYAGDTIRTSCEYHNTTSNQVTWGEGTNDEMCFVFNYVVDDGTLPQMCFTPCDLFPCEQVL